MKPPFRWGWLRSRGFVRTASTALVVILLGVILYNATLVDRVPPNISISLSKVTDASLALTLTTVEVNFSEKVQQGTAESTFSLTQVGAGKVDGTFSWPDEQKLIFTPSNRLPLNTQFTAQVGPGVKDLAGNAEPDLKQLQFKTVNAPSVVKIAPDKRATNVPVDTKIQITFDRFMSTDAVNNAIQIDPSIGDDADKSWSGTVLTITPKKQLQFDTEYTISIDGSAVDNDGTPLPQYESTFTTVPMGLTAVSKMPAPGVAGVSVRTPIAVVFDRPIDPGSISSPFQITPAVSGSTQAIDLPNDSKPSSQAPAPNLHVLLFTPNQALAPHTTYTVTLKPGIRTSGGAAADGQTWSFTTGEQPTTAQNQIVFLSDRAGVSNVWLMNPDGTNPRQVTTELVPVVGYDVSSDGSKLVYTAGGVVKRMSFSGGDVTTMTASGRNEYAPTFTSDGSAVIVGRRDANGADQGYWKVNLGGGEQQVVTSGAPGLGSVTLTGDGLTEDIGLSSWAGRAAYSKDGARMLLVRGDRAVELVDLTGGTPARQLDLSGYGQPVYMKSDDAFYVVAKAPNDTSTSVWRIAKDGTESRVVDGMGDISATPDGKLAILGSNGDVHLQLTSTAGGTPVNLANDPAWSERSPSFAPDGKTIVFSRVFTDQPTKSGGIWIVKTDGTGLTSLATDGICPRWIP